MGSNRFGRMSQSFRHLRRPVLLNATTAWQHTAPAANGLAASTCQAASCRRAVTMTGRRRRLRSSRMRPSPAAWQTHPANGQLQFPQHCLCCRPCLLPLRDRHLYIEGTHGKFSRFLLVRFRLLVFHAQRVTQLYAQQAGWLGSNRSLPRVSSQQPALWPQALHLYLLSTCQFTCDEKTAHVYTQAARRGPPEADHHPGGAAGARQDLPVQQAHVLPQLAGCAHGSVPERRGMSKLRAALCSQP